MYCRKWQEFNSNLNTIKKSNESIMPITYFSPFQLNTKQGTSGRDEKM